MTTALLFGLAASSSLLIGGALGAFWTPPKRVTAAALAFASGALIPALAIDLFAEAFREGGSLYAGIGFLAGAAVFIVVDVLLDRLASGEGGATGFALLAGVILDGVPESLALGIALLESTGTGGTALLVAIFASNLPEALGGAVQMRDHGHSRRFAIGIWGGIGALLAVATLAGYRLLDGLAPEPLAVILAFAAGAMLASLADAVMPQAYREGGPFVAFATAAGFLVAFLLMGP